MTDGLGFAHIIRPTAMAWAHLHGTGWGTSPRVSNCRFDARGRSGGPSPANVFTERFPAQMRRSMMRCVQCDNCGLKVFVEDAKMLEHLGWRLSEEGRPNTWCTACVRAMSAQLQSRRAGQSPRQ
jgi:hypothetical protein